MEVALQGMPENDAVGVVVGVHEPAQGDGGRREIIDGLDAGTIHAVIATGQLIGEGFDCRRLTTLVIATPIRFDGRLVQYLGRVLRPAPGKDHARVYDYVDRRVGPLLKAAQGREQVYRGAREGL